MKRILIAVLILLLGTSSYLIAAKPPAKSSKQPAQPKKNTVIKPQSNLQQVAGAIHLQTPVSGGKRTVADYVSLARQNKMGVVCITDRDNQRYQYGLWPFRWLIKKTEERESVMTFGIDNYLSAINQANKSAQDVIVIDGVEVTPYYYWTGSYFKDTLTLNNRHKHLLVLGLNQAKYYQDLPTVANGKSRFSQYDNIQTYEPYQNLIDYVTKNNGLIYWAHPESNEYREMSGVKVHTLPYAEALEATVNYTGFAVLGEGYQKAGIPGGIWDKTLMEFCAGKRARPVWTIGELDDMGEKALDGVQTVFLLKNQSYQGVLDALKTGKNYTVTKSQGGSALALNDFWIMADNKVAYSGELLTINSKSQMPARPVGGTNSKSQKPTLYIKITSVSKEPVPQSPAPPSKAKDKKAGSKEPKSVAPKTMVTVKIISQGRLVQEYNQALPAEIKYTPDIAGLKPGQMTYFRLDIIDSNQGHLISNPIFIKAE